MFTIAIDGPSGSGKSTTAKLTARRLGARYLDTGAMYRAVAVGCMGAEIDHDDATAIAAYCVGMDLDISTDPDDQYVRLGEADITDAIRAPEVSAWVSAVSTNPECRVDLVKRQRDIIASDNFVAEGRDITTVVAPEAEVRVLLTADPEARMARRGAELGGAVDEAGLRDQILRRDKDDSTLVNFTVAADGVATIDSTFLTPDEVVAQVLLLARRAGIDVD
ncbi:MAG: (d)CMP kinase [Propionibacteriaceae bacterium]|jgi:cytidylate kinase|nr:(d)CMP kinase [Propionibacteriaceae bacterium]